MDRLVDTSFQGEKVNECENKFRFVEFSPVSSKLNDISEESSPGEV